MINVHPYKSICTCINLKLYMCQPEKVKISCNRIPSPCGPVSLAEEGLKTKVSATKVDTDKPHQLV